MSNLDNNNSQEQGFRKIPLVIPTILFLYGGFTSAEIQEIKRAVNNRVDQEYLQKALKVIDLPDSKEIDLNLLTSELEKMLKNDYWNELFLDRIVTRDNLPEIDKLVSINIIVLHKSYDEVDNLVDGLQKISDEINNYLQKNANYNLALIHYGNKDISPEIVKDYWPRFKLSDETLKGIRLEEGHSNECLTTLILALVFSDLLQRTIEQLSSYSNYSDVWVNIGTSVILVDQFSMKEYTKNLVALDVFKSFIIKELSSPDKQYIDKILTTHYEESKIKLLKQALIYITDDYKIQHNGIDINNYEVLPRSEVYKVLESTNDLSSVLQQQIFINTLQKDFSSKSKSLEVYMKTAVDTETELHLKLLEAILKGSINNIALSDKNNFLSKIEPPSGFEAFVYGVERLSQLMNNSTDISLNTKIINPTPLTDENYIHLKCEEIYQHFRNGLYGVQRYFRRFVSPLGMFILLIPAVPLLYFILPSIVNISDLQSVLISSTIIATFGLAEYIWWEVKKTNRLKNLYFSFSDSLTSEAKFFQSIHTMIVNFILSIISKWLRFYRLRIAKYFLSLHEYAQDIEKLMTEEIFSKEVYFRRFDETSFYANEEITTIKFLDLAYCQDLSRSVQSGLNMDRTDYGDFKEYILQTGLVNAIDKLKNPKSVIDMVQVDITNKVNQLFVNGHVQPYVLAEKDEQLSEGKKWWWLDQKAIPLGKIADNYKIDKKFTVFSIGDDAALVGAFGLNSNYWPKDAIVAQLALQNEIECIRGLIVTKKAGNHE